MIEKRNFFIAAAVVLILLPVFFGCENDAGKVPPLDDAEPYFPGSDIGAITRSANGPFQTAFEFINHGF